LNPIYEVEKMRTGNLRGVQMVDEEQGRGMLKIGDVSKKSGIGIEALRFYEKSGLLDKPLRTESGYRVYDASVLERLAFIKQAQALGFSLDEVKRIVEDARQGQSPCDEVREIVSRRLEELDERMREMRRYRKELAETLEEWNKVGRAPGHICGLIETSHVGRGVKDAKKIGRERPPASVEKSGSGNFRRTRKRV
jgi:MerR family copper efflux transcriptional regulator